MGLGGGRSGNPLELCLPGSPSWRKPYPEDAVDDRVLLSDSFPLFQVVGQNDRGVTKLR